MMWLIAKREFRTRTMSKANLISSGIMLVVVIGGALIAKPFLDGESEATVLEVDTATAAPLIPYLDSAAAAQDFDLEVVEVDAGEEPAPSEGAAGVLVGPAEQPQLYLGDGNDALVSVVHGAAQAAVLDERISDLGGDPAGVGDALAAATPDVTVVGDTNDFDGQTFFAGVVVVIVLFFVLIQSASVIMMGVVEEKSSRVVEVLLATVRPATLLGGKVLGVGMYSLVQAATMFVPLVGAAWYLGFMDTLDVPAGLLVTNFAVWFVLGFAVFTILFGGLAALVSRQEDIGSITTPMMFLMMVPLYLAIYLVPNNPDGTATVVLTQVPFFAPFLVPMRAAFGTITTGETVLAIVICLVTIPVLTWIAGRVYAGAVLNTGGRMKLTEAFKRG
ncbi:ABC transporter permease [Demequina globuliformis]|uniref:ABC transporter permease n=1 Tax=Demequina globuliformis TaxID=676202 RepID=UPI000780687C|nr:ABC transporter permease [Demequina globuliformis]